MSQVQWFLVYVALVAAIIYQAWERDTPLIECHKKYGVECELVARPINE